jgi:glycosyltransferase involved in cell wall biosynthesis
MKQPLKVLHVVIGLNMGGIQEFTLNLFTNINKKKYFPIACVIESSGIIGREIELAGYEVIVLNFKRQPFQTIFALVKLIKLKQIDIIHAASYHPSLYAKIAGFLAGVKVVISHEHGLYAKKRTQRVFLNKFLNPVTDHYIAVSRAMADQVMDWYKYPDTKVSVIPNGINTDRFKPSRSKKQAKIKAGLDPNRLVIGMLCRLDPDKGHRFFFKAIKNLSDKYDIQWVVVGGGPDKYIKEIYKSAHSNNVFNKIQFLGIRRDTADLLSAFDCYILPTLREGGCPISALEAMATGCALITSNLPCITEVIKNNKNGLTFSIKKPYLLEKKIELLINDIKLRKKLADQARKTIEEAYSININSKEIENLYDKLWQKKN